MDDAANSVHGGITIDPIDFGRIFHAEHWYSRSQPSKRWLDSTEWKLVSS